MLVRKKEERLRRRKGALRERETDEEREVIFVKREWFTTAVSMATMNNSNEKLHFSNAENDNV